MLSALSWLLCRAPRWLAAALGAALAWLVGVVLRLRRRVAEENLRQAFPELQRGERRRLLCRVYRHLGRVLVATLRLPVMGSRRDRGFIDALERLDSARRGGGAIVVTAHLGYWDQLACAAAAAGLPLVVVTRAIKRPSLNRFWQRLRARFGVRLLPAAGSALSLRRALQADEVVALAVDQHQPGGLETRFFGRPVATSDGPARLALDSGAPVFMAALVDTDQGPSMLFEAVDPPDPSVGPRAERQVVMTQRFNDILEGWVRCYPEQWFWVHRRWKLDSQAADVSAA